MMTRARVRLIIGLTLVFAGIAIVNQSLTNNQFMVALLGTAMSVTGSLYLIVVLARDPH